MNSLVDPYDDRFFRDGQVVGVRYGGTVHQPTVTYETIPNLGAGRFPEPRPRYGEFSPPVIYDNTEPTFKDLLYRPGITENSVKDLLYRPGITEHSVDLLAQAQPSVAPGQRFLLDYIGNLFTGGAGLKKQLNEEIIPNINRRKQATYDAMKQTGVGKVPPGY